MHSWVVILSAVTDLHKTPPPLPPLFLMGVKREGAFNISSASDLIVLVHGVSHDPTTERAYKYAFSKRQIAPLRS